MGLFRTLFIGLMLGLAWLIIRRLLKAPARTPAPTQTPAAMARCAYCQLHIPQAEALVYQGHNFCSQDHRKQWLTSGPQA